ncbi:outer membrane beta-barrel family protein [Fluviicola chungangensis]|uniref:TonB-dependent receptor n=1 Tax=Fluviicola chungangensis TaxID=2597671 RepID=A0A556N0E8_9FLAO|nr:outer membrane beta-barrel family protein [Fluviicola chungangensis]TSJ45636.1 TonB-dependent receptor [Fluviicola chungangensis]
MKLLTLALILFPFTLVAQSTLSGKISNISGEPQIYCKLLLIQDSMVLQTVGTDSIGNYAFESVSSGEYKLSIRVPFQTIDTMVVVNGPTIVDLKIDDGKYLDDVEIIGKKPVVIRKVDRTIFNPTDIPALVGGDASDVIEFAPGVIINGDNIQVAGGSSAQVMLNDKLIPLTGLPLISFIRSIPTEDIQYVEIIPIPPVKYAATVRGSLINIKLVIGAKSRQSKGSLRADFGQRFYNQLGLMANYSYRSGRFSLYSNISANKEKYHYISTKTIDYDTLQWNENGTTVAELGMLTGSVGLNYEINSSTELGLLAVVDNFNGRNTDRSFIEKISNLGYGTIDNLTVNKGIKNQYAFNLNLSKRLDSLGQKLDFNVDYTNYNRNGKINFETDNRDLMSSTHTSIRNQNLAGANLLSGGIDYVLPKKNVNLSFGARYSYSENNTDLAVFNNLTNPEVPDTSQSNKFNYFEHIQAGYAEMQWKKNRWSFQLGIRGENTYYLANSPTSALSIKNDYFELLPKAFAMFETKKSQYWNFNYSRNFVRPNYTDLNPFKYYTTAYSYTTGNPYLKPIILHNLSVSTGVKDFQFYLSFGYIEKMQTNVTIYDEATQVQQTTISNLFSSRSIDFSVNYYKTIKKRTTIDAYISCGYVNRTVISTIASQNLNIFSGYINVSVNQVLDKRESFFLKAAISYHTPYFEQISLTTTRPSMGVKLKKNLLKNRITLELSCSDPFRFQRRSTNTTSNQTTIKQFSYYDTQEVRFCFTYKLGNTRLLVNQHSTNSTGEAGRIGK